MTPAGPPGHDPSDAAAYCAAFIAPGLRCGHRVEQHIIHGSALLECWRCEDWHHFVPNRQRPEAA